MMRLLGIGLVVFAGLLILGGLVCWVLGIWTSGNDPTSTRFLSTAAMTIFLGCISAIGGAILIDESTPGSG